MLRRPTEPLALLLHKAGFKGQKNRIAWAIVMRESRGIPMDESNPYMQGALGIWQIQTSVWQDQPWWSRDNMLDPAKQSKIVYKHLSNKGTYWQPWGISADGLSMDTTHYQRWTAQQQRDWIWTPYWAFYNLYLSAVGA